VIQTSLSNLILYNLCGLLLLLGLMWLCRQWRDAVRARRRRRHVVVCGICGHLFENTTLEQAVECPGCHRLVPRQQVLEL
jgi:DNA-directed RNA polymerase subunit RPC12/RpoP